MSMQNRWDDAELVEPGALAECVYGSRLLGSEPTLVLHGGGNTSVKARVRDVTGDEVEVLHVKGSGWDLATIEARGFAPLRLDRLRAVLQVPELSDAAMMNEFRCALLDSSAPDPSVEALLHAHLPFTAVQHSHADVIVTLTNVADGAASVRAAFGDDVLAVPYCMPGFDLARLVARTWDEQYRPGMVGMVLLNHGLFTFGDSTRQAYERHIDLITRAEEFLSARVPAAPSGHPLPDVPALELATLRAKISELAGQPMIVTRRTDPRTAGFVARPDLGSLATRGPATPDHVIRTKRVPLVGTDVDAFATDYRAYFDANSGRRGVPLTMLDPAPRVVLDPRLGMLTAGRRGKDADIARDIYLHTMDVIEGAEALGGYRALPPEDLFDVEYWELEQAKLRLAGAPPAMAGKVAFVTGAASGIGRACASALLAAGASVVGVDLSESVVGTFSGPEWLGLQLDVTDADATATAIRGGVERFGGLDVLVVAAGIFPASAPIAELDADAWRRTMAVNVDSVASLFSAAHPLLALAPGGGRVVVIASKNVPAPGPGAAAYSASKAALTQLSRVAALEWAGDGIRVNLVHPDAVFDTALWTPELIAERAARYGMSVDEYKRRNLLHTQVTSADVGALTVALCGPAFVATTGAQIPIDGGSDRVI
jgi:rhamnose utilization protein RhaD (predicted bifunctional aldolase and dehydrogenase)/NAD(P)-dependent dehydrogenase (short-subunit alcohol dehydrogenase family)